MSAVYAAAVPVILAITALAGLFKRVDVFDSLVAGAKGGLKTAIGIAPSLVALLPAVYMFRASGAMEALVSLVAPAIEWIGIPAECAPLMLIRPLSGSGALAVASDIIRAHGADSLIGRTAAVMLGSTETTFYVVAVYFGAVGVKRTRHAIPAALAADFTGFLVAALAVRLLFG